MKSLQLKIETILKKFRSTLRVRAKKAWSAFRHQLSRHMVIVISPHQRSHGRTRIIPIHYMSLSLMLLLLCIGTASAVVYHRTHSANHAEILAAQQLETSLRANLDELVTYASEINKEQDLFQQQLTDMFKFISGYEADALWKASRKEAAKKSRRARPPKRDYFQTFFGGDDIAVAEEILAELGEARALAEEGYTHLTNMEKYLVLRQRLAKEIPNGWPLERNSGYKTSAFGPRFSPFSQSIEFHYGVDIAASSGTKVVAASDGIVEVSEERNGYGQVVILRHSFGYKTLYSHNRASLVKPGQAVKKGEPIAEVGNTGRSTGPHLHFEIRIGNKAIDPWSYMVKGFEL